MHRDMEPYSPSCECGCVDACEYAAARPHATPYVCGDGGGGRAPFSARLIVMLARGGRWRLFHVLFLSTICQASLGIYFGLVVCLLRFLLFLLEQREYSEREKKRINKMCRERSA